MHSPVHLQLLLPKRALVGRVVVVRVRVTKLRASRLEKMLIVLRSSAFPAAVQMFCFRLDHESHELVREFTLAHSVKQGSYSVSAAVCLECDGVAMSAEGLLSQHLQVSRAGGQTTAPSQRAVADEQPPALPWSEISLSWRQAAAGRAAWPAGWPSHLGKWVPVGDRLFMKSPVSQQLWEAVYEQSWYDYMRMKDELFWVRHNKLLAEKDMPVFGITLEEAIAFCQDLEGHVAGRYLLDQQCSFHLPDEALWLQARGKLPGKHELSDHGFCKGFPGHSSWKSRPLTMTELERMFPCNTRGLSGMIGNLWDWCAPSSGDSARQSEGIWRGGSWSARDASRDRHIVPASRRSTRCGFRIVASPCPPAL